MFSIHTDVYSIYVLYTQMCIIYNIKTNPTRHLSETTTVLSDQHNHLYTTRACASCITTHLMSQLSPTSRF